MDKLQEILQKNATSPEQSCFENMTLKDMEKFRVDSFNDAPGDRNKEDGYDCPICKNKGIIAEVREYNNGYNMVCHSCKCEAIRRSILKMKRSGLKDIIKDYTFDKFQATEDWQKTVKAAAMDYVKGREGWFFIGGQSGCGKTHICTAICREFLLEGMGVQYMQWRDDAVKLKGLSGEPEQRTRLQDSFKKAEILYIDDLFKTGKSQDGSKQRPTSADINIAFEILNYRYNNPGLLTIISSELLITDIDDIDEAIAGRIFERAKSLEISRNQEKNYRYKNRMIL